MVKEYAFHPMLWDTYRLPCEVNNCKKPSTYADADLCYSIRCSQHRRPEDYKIWRKCNKCNKDRYILNNTDSCYYCYNQMDARY